VAPLPLSATATTTTPTLTTHTTTTTTTPSPKKKKRGRRLSMLDITSPSSPLNNPAAAQQMMQQVGVVALLQIIDAASQVKGSN
jgi:hypothetical protein